MGGLNKEKGKKENEEPIQGINIQEACYQLPALSIYYNYQRRHFIQTQQAGLQKNALKLIIRKYFYQQGQSCGFINTLRLLENLKAINDNLLAQNRYYNEGVQLLNNKQIEKAKNNFEQVIKINPNNTVAKNSRELLNFLLINMDQGGGQGQINQSYKQNTGLFALNPLLVCAFFLNFTVLFFKIKQVNQQQVYKQGEKIKVFKRLIVNLRNKQLGRKLNLNDQYFQKQVEQEDDQSELDYKEGMLLYEKGHYEKALEKFQHISQKSQHFQESIKMAHKILKIVIQVQETDLKHSKFFLKGIQLFHKKNFDAALEQFNSIPQESQYFQVAKQYQSEIQLIDQSLSEDLIIDKENSKLYEEGMALFSRGEFVKSFEILKDVNPKSQYYSPAVKQIFIILQRVLDEQSTDQDYIELYEQGMDLITFSQLNQEFDVKSLEEALKIFDKIAESSKYFQIAKKQKSNIKNKIDEFKVQEQLNEENRNLFENGIKLFKEQKLSESLKELQKVSEKSIYFKDAIKHLNIILQEILDQAQLNNQTVEVYLEGMRLLEWNDLDRALDELLKIPQNSKMFNVATQQIFKIQQMRQASKVNEQKSEQHQELFNQGVKLFQQSKYPESFELLKQVTQESMYFYDAIKYIQIITYSFAKEVKQDEKSIELCGEGIDLFDKGEFKESLEKFKLIPSESKYYKVAIMQISKIEKIIEESRAFEPTKEKSKQLFAKGMDLFKRGEIIQSFKSLKDVDPKSEFFQKAIEQIFTISKQVIDAESVDQNFIELYEEGMRLFDKKSFKEALKQFGLIPQESKYFQLANQQMSNIQNIMDEDQAQEELDKHNQQIIQIGINLSQRKNDEEAFNSLRNVSQKSKYFLQAAEQIFIILKRYIEKSKQEEQSLKILEHGMSLFNIDDYEGSLKEFEKIPEESKHFNIAKNKMKKITEYLTTESKPFYEKGKDLIQQGQPLEALNYFKQVKKRSDYWNEVYQIIAQLENHLEKIKFYTKMRSLINIYEYDQIIKSFVELTNEQNKETLKLVLSEEFDTEKIVLNKKKLYNQALEELDKFLEKFIKKQENKKIYDKAINLYKGKKIRQALQAIDKVDEAIRSEKYGDDGINLIDVALILIIRLSIQKKQTNSKRIKYFLTFCSIVFTCWVLQS